jgi:hypothetical protein
MSATEHVTPIDDDLVELTDEVLESDWQRWSDLVEAFEPLRHQASVDAHDWLRAGINDRSVPLETYAAVSRDDELLGFYAVRRATVEISARAWPLIVEFRGRSGAPRKPEPGLILSWITRGGASDPGYGQTLFDHALGVALEDPHIVAVFVEPDNHDVSELWQNRYDFQPMDRPAPEVPEILWYPTGDAPELVFS